MQVTDCNQSHKDNPFLKEEEETAAEALAQELMNANLSAIYCSDAPHAIQTAQMLATYHQDCPVIIDPALRSFSLTSLFKKIGPLKQLGEGIFQNSAGQSIACVVHECLMNFIGRFLHGGFKGLPNMSYVHVDFDGTGIRLHENIEAG